MNTLTPPPPPSAQQPGIPPQPGMPPQYAGVPPQPPVPGGSGGSRGSGGSGGSGGSRTGIVIAILVAALGALIIVGTVASATVSTIAGSAARDLSYTQPTTGITEIDVEASAAQLTVAFGDVAQAELDIESARGDWSLDRDGSTLVVRSPDGPFFGWFLSGSMSRATLTLPATLEGRLDADLEVGAGSLRADGDFGELELGVDAGSLSVSGSARSVSLDIGAGRADLALRDVAEIDLDISAGRLGAEFTGRAPDSVSVSVSAGSATATLPSAVYDVRSQVEAGSFSNGLESSSTSPRTVAVDVSAGSVTLRAD